MSTVAGGAACEVANWRLAIGITIRKLARMNNDSDRRREEEERQRRLRQEEEEKLTTYTEQDMTEDWQFKIVHGRFNSREKVEAVMREQAVFGWVFVEKFDDGRIRLKRRSSEVENDAKRAGDPYAARSVVAAPGCGFLLMIGLFVLLALTGAVIAR